MALRVNAINMARHLPPIIQPTAEHDMTSPIQVEHMNNSMEDDA